MGEEMFFFTAATVVSSKLNTLHFLWVHDLYVAAEEQAERQTWEPQAWRPLAQGTRMK